MRPLMMKKACTERPPLMTNCTGSERTMAMASSAKRAAIIGWSYRPRGAKFVEWQMTTQLMRRTRRPWTGRSSEPEVETGSGSWMLNREGSVLRREKERQKAMVRSFETPLTSFCPKEFTGFWSAGAWFCIIFASFRVTRASTSVPMTTAAEQVARMALIMGK